MGRPYNQSSRICPAAAARIHFKPIYRIGGTTMSHILYKYIYTSKGNVTHNTLRRRGIAHHQKRHPITIMFARRNIGFGPECGATLVGISGITRIVCVCGRAISTAASGIHSPFTDKTQYPLCANTRVSSIIKFDLFTLADCTAESLIEHPQRSIMLQGVAVVRNIYRLFTKIG